MKLLKLSYCDVPCNDCALNVFGCFLSLSFKIANAAIHVIFFSQRNAIVCNPVLIMYACLEVHGMFDVSFEKKKLLGKCLWSDHFPFLMLFCSYLTLSLYF